MITEVDWTLVEDSSEVSLDAVGLSETCSVETCLNRHKLSFLAAVVCISGRLRRLCLTSVWKDARKMPHIRRQESPAEPPLDVVECRGEALRISEFDFRPVEGTLGVWATHRHMVLKVRFLLCPGFLKAVCRCNLCRFVYCTFSPRCCLLLLTSSHLSLFFLKLFIFAYPPALCYGLCCALR